MLTVFMQKMMSIVARRAFKQTLARTTREIDASPSLLQGANCKVSKSITHFIIFVNIEAKIFNIDF